MPTQKTTDHETIKTWAESRGAKPARVRSTGAEGAPGVLRIDFPGYEGEDALEAIPWDAWFKKFDEEDLAFLFQEETAGGEQSNFNKIVSNDTAG